jgi:hypothetical protein
VLNKHNLFQATKAKTKADTTTSIAMGIVEADAKERDQKTLRLRAARAERDASEKARVNAGPAEKKPSKRKSKT